MLYYPCLALLAKGADVLRADYNYISRADFMALPQDDRRRRAAADALAVYIGAVKQRKYDTITLVGKSIGTYAMGHLITSIPHLSRLQCLWLTPLFKNEHLLSQIKQVKHKALFVAGTADPYYDKANLEDLLNTTGGESIIIEGADHSLEIDGDAMKSLESLELVMKGVMKFIG
jgi:predicted alpha/beta-hydrolase family hydrolase